MKINLKVYYLVIILFGVINPKSSLDIQTEINENNNINEDNIKERG